MENGNRAVDDDPETARGLDEHGTDENLYSHDASESNTSEDAASVEDRAEATNADASSSVADAEDVKDADTLVDEFSREVANASGGEQSTKRPQLCRFHGGFGRAVTGCHAAWTGETPVLLLSRSP